MSDDDALTAAPDAPAADAPAADATASDTTAEARVYLLVGPPAVGKLSIAKELARRTGTLIVDNHLINNPVFVPMGLHSGEGLDITATDELRQRVWDVVLEAAAQAPPELSHVMTNWLPDDPENEAHVERLRGLAERRGARFVPVWLTASDEELLTRVEAAGRAERSKLTDPAVLAQILAVPNMPAPEDALQLDVTDIPPAQAVTEILSFLSDAD